MQARRTVLVFMKFSPWICLFEAWVGPGADYDSWRCLVKRQGLRKGFRQWFPDTLFLRKWIIPPARSRGFCRSGAMARSRRSIAWFPDPSRAAEARRQLPQEGAAGSYPAADRARQRGFPQADRPTRGEMAEPRTLLR